MVARVGGVAYDVVGRGEPVLLLHGGSGRRQWFDALSELLAEEFRMLRVDLPGHGESDHTPGHYRLDDSVDALLGVLEVAGDGPWWVVGHSHGAHVGLVLAALYPEIVRGLVIGDAPLGKARMRQHQSSTARMNRGWRRLTDPELSHEDVLRGFLALEVETADGSVSVDRFFGADHPYVHEMVACLERHDGDFLDAVLERFDDTYRCLDEALLRRVRCEVALLRGDPAAGGLVQDDDEAYLLRNIPQARVLRLRGVGHGLQLQDPHQVADALRQVLGTGAGRVPD